MSLEPGRPIREILAEPLRDENFRKLLVFLASWNFAVGAGRWFESSTVPPSGSNRVRASTGPLGPDTGGSSTTCAPNARFT